VDATRSRVLVLIEEAYAWATGSSPNRNADGDVIARTGVVRPGSGSVTPDGGAAEFSVGILPSAKLIPYLARQLSMLGPVGVPSRRVSAACP
jgi:hypothetical protein